jgi:hypothetical protein
MATEIAEILRGETAQEFEIDNDARRFRRFGDVVGNFLVLGQT